MPLNSPDWETVAKAAYGAYGSITDYKNYAGCLCQIGTTFHRRFGRAWIHAAREAVKTATRS
jgi:hypothetical protein